MVLLILEMKGSGGSGSLPSCCFPRRPWGALAAVALTGGPSAEALGWRGQALAGLTAFLHQSIVGSLF